MNIKERLALSSIHLVGLKCLLCLGLGSVGKFLRDKLMLAVALDLHDWLVYLATILEWVLCPPLRYLGAHPAQFQLKGLVLVVIMHAVDTAESCLRNNRGTHSKLTFLRLPRGHRGMRARKT